MRQKSIKCCSWLLCSGAVLAFVFVLMIAYFTAEVGDDETFNLLVGTAFQQAEQMSGKQMPENMRDQKPIVILGGIMIAITMLGIILACCTKITMHCCCVTVEMFILFALSSILLVFGALLVAPGIGGKKYIEDNCNYANQGQFDMIDEYSRQVFEPIVELDKQFETGVNTQMCTEFCKCPGGPTDSWYIEYKNIPEEEYQKFNRSWYPTVDKTVNPFAEDKSIQWLIVDPTATSTDIFQRTSDTMLKCYENAKEIAVAMAQITGSDLAEEKRKELEEAKPDQIFIDIISHIEDKYNCSGLCQAPLFYLTQSVKNGPPKTPCLQPLIEDAGLLLQNLGATLMVTGILFFFMFLCSLPICYYNKEKAESEKDVDRSHKYKS